MREEQIKEKKATLFKGRAAGRGENSETEGGRSTGSSSAVINLGSDTGLRGLASTVPHNWVTHRGRPTQAIMWRGVGGGLVRVGEGVLAQTHARLLARIVSSVALKSAQPSLVQQEMTEVEPFKGLPSPRRHVEPAALRFVTVATLADMSHLNLDAEKKAATPQVRGSGGDLRRLFDNEPLESSKATFRN